MTLTMLSVMRPNWSKTHVLWVCCSRGDAGYAILVVECDLCDHNEDSSWKRVVLHWYHTTDLAEFCPCGDGHSVRNFQFHTK